MSSLISRRRMNQQPQYAAGVSAEFLDKSALCLLPNSLELTNLAQSNHGKRLTKVSPVLAVTKSGRGVACSNTTRSYVDSNWLPPIQTSQSDGRGEFSVLIVITLRSSGSRAFPFHIRENAGAFNSVFLVQNGYYTEGGTSSIAQSGTLYFGTFDGASGAAGIALPGVLTSTPREFKLLFNRFADGSRELWVDGVLAASAGPYFSRPICTGAAQYLSIGGNALNDGFASNDPINLVYAANKAFGWNQSASLTNNPWQIFQAPQPIFVVTTTSGGTTYTITPSGSISYSGSVTSVRTRVVGASGTITYQGNAPLTKVSAVNIYTITPSGNITYLGTAPLSQVITNHYTISPTGNITYSGTKKLTTSHTIFPTGDIAFSGQTINVKVSVVRPTGNISFTGTAQLYVPGSYVITTKLPMTGAGT